MPTVSMAEGSKDNLMANLFLAGLCLLIVLRLVVWKFFPVLDTFVKEDLSNLLCVAPILLFAVVFYLHRVLKGRPLQERRTGLEPALWVFFATCVLSFFTSVDRAFTLRYVEVWFAYILFFFMLTDTLDSQLRRKWFLVFIMGLALVIAGWGIRDYIYLVTRPPDPADAALANTNDSLYYILRNKRACSFFGWPNVLAGFLGLTIPLGFTVALMWRAWWAKLAAVIAVTVMVLALLMTFSVLGWLSLLLGFVVAAGILFARREDVGRGVRVALTVFAVIAAVMFTVVILRKNFAIAVTPRQQYFQQTVAGIKEHPFLGTGLDTFRYLSSRMATDRGGLTAFAHNSYLQCWVESGLPGLLAMLALVFVVLAKFYRLAWRVGEGWEVRLRYAAFAWACTAFFVDNIWSFTIIKANISLFFWMFLAYICSFDTRSVQRREVLRKLRPVGGWLAVLVLCAAFLLTVRSLAVQWMFRAALVAEGKGQPEETLRAFKRARELDPNDSKVAYETGKRYLQFYQQTPDPRLLALAEQEFLSAADTSPSYIPRALLGLIYQHLGRKRDASEWLSESYRMAPLETERDLQAVGAKPKTAN